MVAKLLVHPKNNKLFTHSNDWLSFRECKMIILNNVDKVGKKYTPY